MAKFPRTRTGMFGRAPEPKYHRAGQSHLLREGDRHRPRSHEGSDSVQYATAEVRGSRVAHEEYSPSHRTARDRASRAHVAPAEPLPEVSGAASGRASLGRPQPDRRQPPETEARSSVASACLAASNVRRGIKILCMFGAEVCLGPFRTVA